MKGQIVAEPTNAGIVVMYRITGGDEKRLKYLPRHNLNMLYVIQGCVHHTMFAEL
jgi:hypothetical protein